MEKSADVFSEMLYGSVIACKDCQLMSDISKIGGHASLKCGWQKAQRMAEMT